MVVDYYALLGVDRHTSRADIEAALGRCQEVWRERSRGNDPGEAGRYRSYLAAVPAIRRALLGSTSGRAAYDAELFSLHHGSRERQLDRLQRLVELRAAKGGLSVSDRHQLRVEAERHGIAREVVDRMASSFAPWPEPPAERTHGPAAAAEPESRLPHGEYQSLAQRLDELGRSDLYEAIGLASDADDNVIAARLAELRALKGDAASDPALAELRMLAERHLGTPRTRTHYDRAAEHDRLLKLEDLVTHTLKGAQRLDLTTRSALAAEAAALGIEPDTFDRVVRRACRDEGVALEVQPAAVRPDAPAGPPRWLRCPRCHALTDLDTAQKSELPACGQCQAPLRWECPLCHRSHWVDETRCQCDFPRAHVRPLLERFEAAQNAFRARRFLESLEHLRQVQKYAPRHVGARKAVEKIQQQVSEIRKTRAAYKMEKAGRQWVAALATIDRWSRLVSPTDSRLKAALEETTDTLAAARSRTCKADELAHVDPKRARTLYRQALSLVADLPEAIAGLGHCPPDGPTDLTAHVADGSIRLRWKPPEPDGLGPCEFLVLRRPDAQPQHADDGSVVATVSDPEWTDTPIPSGSNLGYAVFATRNGVRSILGVATGPLLVIDEVRNLFIEPESQAIKLRWTAPPGIAAMRLVRKLGEPVKNLRDGVIVKAGRDGAVDRGLTDGQVYHYGIFALFRGPGARLHPSRGVFCSAVPGRAPEPIADLRIVDDGARGSALTLGWTPTARGVARIARLGVAPGWVPGQRRRLAEVDALNATWLEEVAPGRGIDHSPLAGTPCVYLPLVVQNGLAVAGEPLNYARVPDPTSLRAYRSWSEPDRVTLTWRWPAEPSEARCVVVARAGRPATGPNDPDARTFEVTHTAYQRDGAFHVRLPHRSDLAWHVGVYSVCQIDGVPWTSPGREPTARTTVPGTNPPVLVYYTLQPGGAGRSWSIGLRTEPPGAAVGPTVLVAQPRLLPLTAREGLLVARFGEARDGDKLRFDPTTRLEGRRLRLLADPEALTGPFPTIRLCLPDEP